MRDFGGDILLSASDLMRFMGCAHSTTLDLMHVRGEGPEPQKDSDEAVLLQKHGGVHEAAHLAALKVAGRRVLEIDRGDGSRASLRLADYAQYARAAHARHSMRRLRALPVGRTL